MVDAPSLDDFRSALAPVEALRGEQSQLETWVRESFATLEVLHNDLEEWQRELTRAQAELDQREAGVADAERQCGASCTEVAQLQEKLNQTQDEARQLEEENAEQLQALDDLERQLVAAQAELRTVRMHADEVALALEAERERAADEQRQWGGDLRDMRRLLLQQNAMLISLGATAQSEDGEAEGQGASANAADHAEGDAPSAGSDPASRAAELRRRASSRRAGRRTN